MGVGTGIPSKDAFGIGVSVLSAVEQRLGPKCLEGLGVFAGGGLRA